MQLGIMARHVLRLRWSSLHSCKINRRSFQIKSRQRNLKVKDLNSALKPFYFMVHPDLFGNFPEKRKINENSLKKLNSFLQGLVAKKRQPCREVSLRFFLRDPHQQEFDLITEVSINLQGGSPFIVVEKILESAGLPGLKSEDKKITKAHAKLLQRNIIHHPTDHEQRSPEQKLVGFLEKKSPVARTRLNSTSKVRYQIAALIENICEDLGFKSLSVESKWRIHLLYGYLKNFHECLQKHRVEIGKAAGWKVVLGSWSGIDTSGTINLNIEDEPLSWIKTLSSVERFATMLQDTEKLMLAVSQMLGGLTVIDVEYEKKHCHLDKYLRILTDLYSKLNSSVSSDRFNLDLSNYKAVISSCTMTASVLPNGLFVIPLSMSHLEIIVFLTASFNEAKCTKAIYERKLVRERLLSELCKRHLELSSLTKSSDINHTQMISCCEDLIDIESYLTKGLEVKIGQVYHMSADGELTIPWNWKEMC